MGFNAALNSLIFLQNDHIRNYILDKKSPIYDLVNINKIEKLLKRKKLKNSESKFLFSLISSKIFLEGNVWKNSKLNGAKNVFCQTLDQI